MPHNMHEERGRGDWGKISAIRRRWISGGKLEDTREIRKSPERLRMRINAWGLNCAPAETSVQTRDKKHEFRSRPNTTRQNGSNVEFNIVPRRQCSADRYRRTRRLSEWQNELTVCTHSATRENEKLAKIKRKQKGRNNERKWGSKKNREDKSLYLRWTQSITYFAEHILWYVMEKKRKTEKNEEEKKRRNKIMKRRETKKYEKK